MDLIEYLYSATGYLGLISFLLTFFVMIVCVQSLGYWIWERYGERISGVFRQPDA